MSKAEKPMSLSIIEGAHVPRRTPGHVVGFAQDGREFTAKTQTESMASLWFQALPHLRPGLTTYSSGRAPCTANDFGM